MKIRLVAFTIALLISTWTLHPMVAQAEVETGEWSAGFRVNGVLPDDKDTDNTVGFMGSLTYQATPYLRGEIESGWAQIDEDILGDLNIWPLFGNVHITWPTENAFTPYVLGGVGVLFTDFDESQLVKDVGASLDTDTVLAFKVGGGLDYRFNESVALNLEASFIIGEGEADLKQGSTTLATDDLEYDSWMVGGGLRVYW